MKQDPPFALQVSLTTGCDQACSFCALQAIRDNGADWKTGTHGPKNSSPFDFMSFETAKRVATEVARLGWSCRVEFAGHGEPSLNPKFIEIISVFRQALPHNHLMMTSNGAAFAKIEKIIGAFEAGLNTLALDDYKHAKTVPKIIKALNDSFAARLDSLGVSIYEYPQQKEGNPHRRLKSTERMLVFVEDITEATKGTHSNVTNQGVNSGAPDYSMKDKRCAKMFRELTVRSDGYVAICCDSWQGKYLIGNVADLSLDEIWNHPRFYAARQENYHNGRTFEPCYGCNVKSYRTGLLPDKLGKETMPKPNQSTRENIAAAIKAGRQYALNIRR